MDPDESSHAPQGDMSQDAAETLASHQDQAPQYPYPAPGQPPLPYGPPRRKIPVGVIKAVSILAVALVLVAGRAVYIALTAHPAASPVQSSAPPATFTLPTDAGPMTLLTGAPAQAIEDALQNTLADERKAVGGTLDLGAYSSTSYGSLNAVLMGNATGALPKLAPVVASDGYLDFVNGVVQSAGLANVTEPPPAATGNGAMVCGTQAGSGDVLALCLWIDSETYGVVMFATPITADVVDGLGNAEYDAQELRAAIEGSS
jgi:hypothetical protein